MAHRVYVRYGFVERGDPALAWLSMVLLLLLMPQETLAAAARSWLALLLLLAAVDQILQAHRQTSTSGLQFRRRGPRIPSPPCSNRFISGSFWPC